MQAFPKFPVPSREGVKQMQHGSFISRAVAKMIDWLIASLFCFAFISIWNGKTPLARDSFIIAQLVSVALFNAAYSVAFLEKFRATPGKMVLGLEVVTSEGDPISLKRAFARYFAEGLSNCFFYLGYLVAVIDKQKRTLHDLICHTQVVYTLPYWHYFHRSGPHYTSDGHPILLTADSYTPYTPPSRWRLAAGSFLTLILSCGCLWLFVAVAGRSIAGGLAVSPDGKTLASDGFRDTVRLWRVEDGKLLYTLEGHQGSVISIAFSPDGQTLATGLVNNVVQLWRVKDGNLLHTFTGHSSYVTSVAFAPDGQVLATGSGDETVRLWQIDDGALLYTLEGHQGGVTSVAFSPDGQMLATGLVNKVAQLWKVNDGNLLQTFTGHSNNVTSIAFAPDGQILATGSDDGTVRLWRVSDGTLQRILNCGSSNWVTSVSFSPDGQLLAAGVNDYKIWLWRVYDGTLLRTLEGHRAAVTSTVFMPDGQRLASRSNDDTVRLWRVSDGALLRTLSK